MRALLLLLGVILLVICLPLQFDAIHDARVDTYTQTYAEIETAVGVTSANVTLSTDLWAGAPVSVLSVSSNITGDSPSASAYNGVSRTLTIGGLTSSSERSLAVEYEIESASEYVDTVNAFLLIVVVIIVLSIIGLLGRAIYEFFT